MESCCKERETRRFIELIRQNPCIWDFHDPEYHDRNVSREAYIRIGREMNITEEEARKKQRNLRNQYVQNLHAYTEECKKNGGSEDGVRLPRWKYFAFLDFLRPSVKFSPDGHKDFLKASAKNPIQQELDQMLKLQSQQSPQDDAEQDSGSMILECESHDEDLAPHSVLDRLMQRVGAELGPKLRQELEPAQPVLFKHQQDPEMSQTGPPINPIKSSPASSQATTQLPSGAILLVPSTLPLAHSDLPQTSGRHTLDRDVKEFTPIVLKPKQKHTEQSHCPVLPNLKRKHSEEIQSNPPTLPELKRKHADEIVSALLDLSQSVNNNGAQKDTGLTENDYFFKLIACKVARLPEESQVLVRDQIYQVVDDQLKKEREKKDNS